MDKPAFPIPGLETRVIAGLENLVASLPKSVAGLSVGRHPTDSTCVVPYFEVTPSNRGSAGIKGVISENVGIEVGVGRASYKELYLSGGNIIKGMSCEEELLKICHAVFAGNFSEEIKYDSHGKISSSRLTLTVVGIDVRFDSGIALKNLFQKARTETISYEPYF